MWNKNKGSSAGAVVCMCFHSHDSFICRDGHGADNFHFCILVSVRPQTKSCAFSKKEHWQRGASQTLTHAAFRNESHVRFHTSGHLITSHDPLGQTLDTISRFVFIFSLTVLYSPSVSKSPAASKTNWRGTQLSLLVYGKNIWWILEVNSQSQKNELGLVYFSSTDLIAAIISNQINWTFCADRKCCAYLQCLP